MTLPKSASDSVRRARIRLLLIWVGVGVGLAGSVVAGGVDLASWIRGEPTGSMGRLERIDAMRTAFTEERWNDALTHARALSDVLRDDPEAMRIEATSLVRMGRAGEAVPVLLRLVDKEPGDATTRLALGRALLEAGRPSEARAVLAAVHRNPLASREVRMAAMGMMVRAETLAPDTPALPEGRDRSTGPIGAGR